MKIFVLFRKESGFNPEPLFAFHAPNDANAESMKIGWARHHGFDPRDWGIEEYPNFREANVFVRDDYVEHPTRSPKFLSFYEFDSPHSSRARLIECHLITTRKLDEVVVRNLLGYLANVSFQADWKIIENVRSNTLSKSPVFGLVAEDINDRLIIPVKE